MNTGHVDTIARELGLSAQQVGATAALLEEGATVPFIARYRKEATNLLDEVAIGSIRQRLEQLAEVDKKRASILASLAERELLTEDLDEQIRAAVTLAALNDIYLPYRVKRRTRATIARERGLEPLAEALFRQDHHRPIDPQKAAAAFTNEEHGIATADDALQGARDIIAENVAENASARESLRQLFADKGLITSKVRKDMQDAGAKFRDYFEWQEPVSRVPSHRAMAMLRGEAEGILSLRISPPEDDALRLLDRLFVRGVTPASQQVRAAVHDGYKRLLCASVENEIRAEMKRAAEEAAIRVFADNLRELLLAAPLGQRRVMALDPGFRTGCKLVCLDAQGQLQHHETVYPHSGARQAAEAEHTVRILCERFDTEAIAIGNGTAGRETEAFVRGLGLAESVAIVMVNEAGASIYSASEAARAEFPDHDLTVRGAVSIGRRLMDALAELVKIDPKSIGVGQYQHDVDQAALRRSLDDTVMSCVNGVGVDVNTASKQLLTYVSGLGPKLAGNIVSYRDEHGAFSTRAQLKKVPRLGAKAFEQAAGFLRIHNGQSPLDASAVHPESYHIVDAMARDVGGSVAQLMRDDALRGRIETRRYVCDTIGLPTLRDILGELSRPGRDPRPQFEAFAFAEGIEKIADLSVGMRLPGIVTNVTGFGAFVDIGVHQDGLVHISQLADRFVQDPADVVKIQQRVTVTVMDIDLQRQRIALSMKAKAL